MHRHRPAPAAAGGSAEVVDEKLGELPGPLCDASGGLGTRGLVKQKRELVHDHVGAGPRRDDDRSLGGIEDVYGVGCHRPGIVSVAGVVCGLTATGLVERELDGLAEAFKDLDACPPHLGGESIHQAGDEELNRHHG